MADENDRTARGDAMWKQFLGLVPPELLAAPPPRPVPAPTPEPVPQAVADDAAKARRIELEIAEERRKADREILKIEREAHQFALDTLHGMHETQKKLKL